MRQSRFNAIYNGLNSIAKKVYQIVPISESWSTHKIMREIDRTGLGMDLRVVQGALGHMVEVGVILKNKEGDFIRTPIKVPTPNEPETDNNEDEDNVDIPTEVKKAVSSVKPVNSTIEQILALSHRALEISVQMHTLSEDIEKMARTINEKDKDTEEKLAQLRQLRALLSNLKD